MNDRNNIDTIVAELDHIYETYQRYENFDEQTENVKSRHRAEENAITSAMKDKMKSFEEKRRSQNNMTKPTIDKALRTPIPDLPAFPSSKDHKKAMFFGSASGLAIPGGLALYLIGSKGDLIFSGFLAFLFQLLSMVGGALLIGGLFAWILLGGYLSVESYLAWQKEILEYDKKMKEWEGAYSKLDPIPSSNKLVADVAAYEKEFLSIVKDCNAAADEMLKEMKEAKIKLSEQHAVELDEREKEWNEICAELNSVTLIHSDLFYIAWRISSALERGRATTLQEAINIAIDDERLAREEAARQAEARRQEAILQRQAEDARRHNEEIERAARQQAGDARRHNEAMERAAREQAQAAARQAREAENAAHRRCWVCANKDKCYIRHTSSAIGCPSYRPK